jgi:hypothetical protein
MNKEKLNAIKNKIKYRAPEIAVATTVSLGILAAIKLIKSDLSSTGKSALVFFDDGDGFPCVTGDERDAILGAKDSILNRLNAQDYILSLPDPTEV